MGCVVVANGRDELTRASENFLFWIRGNGAKGGKSWLYRVVREDTIQCCSIFRNEVGQHCVLLQEYRNT